nr:Phage-related minor tail protein [uncultured Mediterranean phage uvMED]
MAFSSHFKALMSLDSASFEQGLVKAQGKVKKFNSELSGMFTRFLGATALVGFTNNVIQFGASLGDVSKKLGVSSDFLQKFRYSAEQSGVGAKEAELGLQRLLRRAGTAQQEGGALADLLKDMGVELKNLDGSFKSGEQIFVDFADAMGKIEDPNEKLVKGFKLLDSEGLNLLNLISDGADSFKKFSKEAEDAGLIIDGVTIKSMQDLDGELKKTSTKFKILGASILPSVIKYLNLAVIGWQGIFEAVKSAKTGIELIGKTLKSFLGDILKRTASQLDVFKAKLEAFSVKINPFANDIDIKNAEMNLAKMEKKYAEVARSTGKTMEQTRVAVLKKDKELDKARTGHINKFKQLSKEANNILNDRNDINLKDVDNQKQTEQVLQRINKSREDVNVKLQTAIERVNALKKGGEEELALVLKRQKAEDQISQLMKDGNISKEEATKTIKKLLDLEDQEKQLHQKIKDEKKQQVELLKKKKDRADLLANLEKEKKLQEDLLKVDKDIEKARLKGDAGAEKRLDAKRILIQLRNAEAGQVDILGKKLMAELKTIRDKRDVADAEVKILDLLAQGRDKEAQLLQASLDIQKQLKGIMDDLDIAEKEAIKRKENELVLQNKIALKKLAQQQQQIKDNAVNELAQKKANDAVDREGRKRILSAQKVKRLDADILKLKQRGDDRAKREIEKLESIRTREMKIILDDDTKEDLENLDKSKVKLKDQHDANMKALKDRLADVNKAEKAQQNQIKKNLDKIQKKKLEVLSNEKLVVLKAKEVFENVGADVGKNLLAIGGDLISKIKGIKKTPKIDFKPNINNSVNVKAPDLSGLNSIVSTIPTAIGNIKFPEFPEFPEPAPTIVKVDVDTENLLTESTGKNIELALKGKFINQ